MSFIWCVYVFCRQFLKDEWTCYGNIKMHIFVDYEPVIWSATDVTNNTAPEIISCKFDQIRTSDSIFFGHE